MSHQLSPDEMAAAMKRLGVPASKAEQFAKKFQTAVSGKPAPVLARVVSGLTITVPMPRNIANGSHSHWSVRDKQRKAYLEALDLLQLAKQIPAPPEHPFQRARLDSVMHLANQMDPDNAARRHKWPLDWLKTRGYIVDDSPTHLEWVSFPEQHIRRDGNYRIELTLTEL